MQREKYLFDSNKYCLNQTYFFFAIYDQTNICLIKIYYFFVLIYLI